jgi:hypothetical protein
MNEVADSSEEEDDQRTGHPNIEFIASEPPSPAEGLHTPHETRDDDANSWWRLPVIQNSLSAVSRLLVGQASYRPDMPLQIQHFTHIPHRARLNHQQRMSSDGNHHHPPDAIDYNSADQDDDDLIIDLTGALHCYRRTPNEYYGNIVAAALANRGLDHPVTGAELREAGGVPFLVKAILACGFLDLLDPLTELEVQRNIDACIFPDFERFSGRINPVHYEFLRCLFTVPSAYVNGTQRALLHRSGFEFVKLLHDLPHVERFIPAPRVLSWDYCMEKTRLLDLPIMLVSLSVTLLAVASLAYIMYFWWSTKTENFFVWTVATYIGGIVTDIIATALILNTKSDSSIYEDLTVEFPSVYTKILPLYDIVLAFNAVKLTLSSADCFILRHDMFSAFDTSRWSHVLCVCLPQLLLQSYFFFWSPSLEYTSFDGYRIFVGASSSLIFLSFPLYLRMVTSGNSVTSTGFACFGDSSTKMMERGQGFPRMLTYTLLYVFEINVFFLVVAVLNVGLCSTNMIVWIIVASVIVLSTGVMFIYTLLSSKSMVRAAKWAIPPIVCQIAFTIFVASVPSQVASSSPGGKDDCKVFFLLSGANVAAGYASWGALCFILGIWGIKKLYTMYTEDRQQAEANSNAAAAAANTAAPF